MPSKVEIKVETIINAERGLYDKTLDWRDSDVEVKSKYIKTGHHWYVNIAKTMASMS